MNGPRVVRVIKLFASGACLLQAAGCDMLTLNDYLQTIFLGIAAAGGIAIIQNI